MACVMFFGFGYLGSPSNKVFAIDVALGQIQTMLISERNGICNRGREGNLNPRRARDVQTPPQMLRELRKNGVAQRRRFSCLFIHLFPNPSENFSPGSSQVRPPGPVKRPNLRNICDCAVATVFKGSTRNCQKLTGESGPTKCLSRNFYFDDLRSDQFLTRPL